MTKSIFGLKLSAIAILIFVICFFGSTEVLILLGAFALLLEKNRWLTKQAFQALYLKLSYIIALRAVGWVFDFSVSCSVGPAFSQQRKTSSIFCWGWPSCCWSCWRSCVSIVKKMPTCPCLPIWPTIR